MERQPIQHLMGQTLVLVAIGLLALAAIVALAVDTGNVYAERRRMQNAADAGALAGARAICFENANDDTAIIEARAYARENGAQGDPVVEVSRTVDADGWTRRAFVTVTATEIASTYFAGVIGFREVDISADATAACGAAASGSGMWPVALNILEWEALYDDGDGCGKEFYVWTSDKIIDCDVENCDLDGDGRDDIIVGGDRGWLDFSAPVRPFDDDCVQPGCGANELGCQILNDAGAYIELPTCIPGDSGGKSGVKNQVELRIHDTVKIPLYDGIGCESDRDCPGGLRYHVPAVGCVEVLEWVQQAPLGNGVSAIKVAIDCEGCSTSTGGTDGQPAEPWQLRAVSLVD